MAKNRDTRKVNLDELTANPDKIYELIDECGSDFEIESDYDDDYFEPNIADEKSDEENNIEEENPEPSTSKNVPSVGIKWTKDSFASKNISEESNGTDDINDVLSPFGYFSRYLDDDFFEMGAKLTSQYYLQETGMEIKPDISPEEIKQFFARTAWKKHHLQWYFPQRTVDAQKDAEMAFQMWQNVSNLTFTMVTTPGVDPPDITITMVSKTHYFRRNCMGGDECPTKVGGAVLGHSYFPNSDGTCIEIDLDIDQSWHFGTDSIPEGRTSFLMVLVHEIGHALGIAHSATPNAIMYSVYADKIRVLHGDDINQRIITTEKRHDRT
uniref:Macrophage metalloelastase-like n=1 Tax=Diabrotica virgifera virgifera TaxID=50390 RepID=A0A6P7GEF2_DIAVI